MSKFVALILVLACVVGCAKEPQTETTVGHDFRIGLLFEHEGCKVYRFRDAGEFVYFTNCTSTTYTDVESYPCGKTQCIRREPRMVANYREQAP